MADPTAAKALAFVKYLFVPSGKFVVDSKDKAFAISALIEKLVGSWETANFPSELSIATPFASPSLKA